MRSPLLTALALCAAASTLPSQDVPPPNGPRQVDPGWHALVGARVIVAPGQVLDRATVVIRDGRIVAVEPGGMAPEGARVHDCAGMTVHAAFVDAHVPVEAPRPDPMAPGSSWHPDVLPQRSALDGIGLPAELAKELRGLGFAVAAVHPQDGIIRGRSGIVTLEDVATDARRATLAGTDRIEIAFDRSRGGYPGSLMGSIALVRQTLADADHDGRSASPGGPETAFGALRATRATMFVGRDEVDLLRCARVLREFGRTDGSVLLGSGLEFRRLDNVTALGMPLVVPLAFPAPPEVETVDGAESVDLRQMLTWEHAPTNPARLGRAGVTFALTTDRLDKRSSFLPNLRKAIEHGLGADEALAALTTTPAQLLGLTDQLGTVEVGKLAHLCVVDGEPFAEDRTLRAVFVGGKHHTVEAAPTLILAGSWETKLEHGGVSVAELRFDDERKLTLVGSGGEEPPSASARKVEKGARKVDVLFDASKLGGDGTWKLTALVQGDRMSGIGVAADGGRFAWTARRKPKDEAEDSPEEEGGKSESPKPDLLGTALPVPFGAFGRTSAPAQQDVIVRGATIWTAGPAGRIDGGVLVVRDGSIAYAGPADGAPALEGALVIDGSGLHVTPGLIDCHSHTGIEGGVNEGSQAVTSEVRIGDVLDPDDIHWYRELAGGLTAANQLHGSANPIGGQNQVVKLRWGVADPEAMKLAGSIPGIKFALGENVKRSRSSDNTRYPNTRMGVEALIRDRFTAAREYDLAVRGPDRATVRRDLELEALAEILRGDRLVHCHSYRQDEILMLCRLAEEFGFRIGTFQHGLEGYKVAEAIREAAIGASIFSDWWAYKYEVVDAIPENGTIMTRVGVNVSFNSDSNELARRMNTEAAKAVKYGGLDPHDALKLVTINPAIQLGVGDRIGSLEIGKDADFVIWSGDPLSTFSRCLETWIDGCRYWSEAEDRELVATAAAERARLIQAVLAAPGERARGDRGRSGDNRPGDCDCLDGADVYFEELRTTNGGVR
ncbi:MAG: amidohydrolase family protein [Planctomycetota bacterium]|nr:amidohydrolase family protein [Planctomycetota bacterium]